MRFLFKILFSPVLIAWWLCKLIIRILTIPVVILWYLLKTLAPELTRPFQGLADGLAGLFRLWK